VRDRLPAPRSGARISLCAAVAAVAALGAACGAPSLTSTVRASDASTSTTVVPTTTTTAAPATDADGCRLAVEGEWVCNWAGPGDATGEGGLVHSIRFTDEFHCGAWPEQRASELGQWRSGGPLPVTTRPM
jgi:hypothetical protein